MPLVKQNWARTPNAWVFNTLGTESIGPLSIAAGQANTAVPPAGVLVLPTSVKVVKVAYTLLSIGTGGTHSFNVVYNTSPTFAGGAYLANGPAPNDNSITGPNYGPNYSTANPNVANPNPALTAASPGWIQQGNLGIPTNFAVDNQPLFSADITVTAGGVGVLVPTNYDAVYPSAINPPYTAAGFTQLPAYFSIRATTPASTGAINNLVVTLFYEPITIKQNVSVTANVVTPGVDF